MGSRPELPSGIVTFLFTDIEGSTRLLKQLRGGYAAVLAEHHELLGAAFAANRGPVALARSGGLVATAGLGLALAIGSVPVAIEGFAAMGAGLGVVVPVLFRAAASTATVSASTGVAAVSMIGWFGFLAGPPAIGFAASAVGLRPALGIVVLATLTLAALAGSAGPSRRDPRVPRVAPALDGARCA